jgi:hypothetical protein
MPKRMIRYRPRSFVQQARMRRARAAAGPPVVSSQSKGVRLGRDGRVIMNRTERRRTAYHEAGHAVIYAALGIRFRLVTVIPSVHLLGRIERRRPFGGRVRQPRIQIERFLLGTLAGGIAERLSRRDGQASGLEEDEQFVLGLLRSLPGCRTMTGRVRRHIAMYVRAQRLVRRHWKVIDEVAEGLICDKTLTEGQVLRELRDADRFEELYLSIVQGGLRSVVEQLLDGAQGWRPSEELRVEIDRLLATTVESTAR